MRIVSLCETDDLTLVRAERDVIILSEGLPQREQESGQVVLDDVFEGETESQTRQPGCPDHRADQGGGAVRQFPDPIPGWLESLSERGRELDPVLDPDDAFLLSDQLLGPYSRRRAGLGSGRGRNEKGRQEFPAGREVADSGLVRAADKETRSGVDLLSVLLSVDPGRRRHPDGAR